VQTNFRTMLVYSELEKDLPKWVPNWGANIDSDSPDKMLASTAFDGSLQIDNVSCVNVTKPGGGLVSRKLSYDARMSKLPFSGLDLEFMLVAGNFARIEIDRKDVSFAPPAGAQDAPNTDDFSSQLNGSLNWQHQVDDVTRKWAPPFGYTPTCFKTGVPMMQWIRFSARFYTDYAKATFSYRSIAIGGDAPQFLPATLLEIPRMRSNWSPVIDVQLQLKGATLGILTARYRNITVSFGDQAF
jgi:hypothetical protein